MVNEEKEAHPEVAFPPIIHVTKLDTSNDGRRTISSGYAYLTFQGGDTSYLILCLFNSFLDSDSNSKIQPLCCIAGISPYHSIVILIHNLSLYTECNTYISLLCSHLLPYWEPSFIKLAEESGIPSLYLYSSDCTHSSFFVWILNHRLHEVGMMFLINSQRPCHDNSEFCFRSLGISIIRINIFNHLSSNFAVRPTAFLHWCNWVPPPLPYFYISHFSYSKVYERQEISLKSETLCLLNQLKLMEPMRTHGRALPDVNRLSCHPHHHLILWAFILGWTRKETMPKSFFCKDKEFFILRSSFT